MATFIFFLIQVAASVDGDVDELLSPLELPAGPTWWRAGTNWIGCALNDPRVLLSKMSKASEMLGTVAVGVLLQTNSCVFEMRVCSKGREIRTVAYSFDDGGWQESDGEQQPWEEEVFFSEEALNSDLNYSESEQESEIRKIYAGKKIVVGSMFPSGIDHSLANRIVAALGCKFPQASEVKKGPTSKSWGQRIWSLFGA